MDFFYAPWIKGSKQSVDSEDDNDYFKPNQDPVKASFNNPSSVFYALPEHDRDTTKPIYKFTYFNAKGNGESVRLMLVYLRIPFIDNRITLDEFMKKQDDLIFRQLPLLELQDGTILCNSNTIARFIAKEYGLAGGSNVEQAKADEIIDNITGLMSDTRGYLICQVENKDRLTQLDTTEVNVHATTAQNALDRFLPQLELVCSGALRHQHGYILESGISFADFSVATLYTLICSSFPCHTKQYKALQHVVEKIHSLPQLQFYLKSRPTTYY